jgi:plasmid replication initiation protein
MEINPQEVKKDIHIYQGNAITNARYEMSALEKQIIYVMLSLVKQSEREAGVLNYKIKIKDLESMTNKHITNYTEIREATKKLLGRIYEIPDKDKVSGKKVIIQTALISFAKYVDGTGEIELGINREIRPYLLEMAKGYTKYSLECALCLKSIYSQRLYEILSRYQDLGVWKIKVEDLKYMLKIEDKYKGYGMFKKKVIDVAEQEISEKTNIKCKVETRKAGKRVDELIFLIDRKIVVEPLEIEFDNTAKIKNRLKGNDLSPWQIDKIIEQLDEKEINKVLYDINLMKTSGQIKKTVGGYTWATFQSKGVK